jgi:hypothetical protein
VVERRKRDREREVFSFSLDLGGGCYKERSGGVDVFIIKVWSYLPHPLPVKIISYYNSTLR